MSRIFFRDGRVEEYPTDLAYLIWLNVPGTAIRVAGDPPAQTNRQAIEWHMMPWEYNSGDGHD